MKEQERKIIAQAKKKLRTYQISERFTAGLVLSGSEIKSLRHYRSSIDEAYILPQQGELYIINMHITPYKYSPTSGLISNWNPKRKRKLLLQKREIKKLTSQLKSKNYLLVPLLLFINQQGWAKLEIAFAQPLRKYQIKEKIKDREIKKKLHKKDFW